jgi:tetratricopeptide (TPR) repeat protein
MAQITFSHAWLELLDDPYAVLGLPLNADEKSVLKQYRLLAKQLHPDRYGQADPKQQEFVGQLVARLLNPAHGKIKQARDRAEILAVLRLQAQQLSRSGDFRPTSEVALMLMQQPLAGAEIFYASQVAQLAEQQYESFNQFGNITHQLHELNLVYLIRKLGSVAQPQTVNDLAAKAPRAAAPTTTPSTTSVVAPTVAPAVPKISPEEADRTIQEGYARRHYERAEQYIEKGAYDRAAQEMKDALRLVADKSEYHALLSYAYLLQDLPGMAVVYCRQALKLNPKDIRAVKLAKKLNIVTSAGTAAKPVAATPAKRGLLGGLFRGK